ncbi:2Fe-2S iron-sulfur cluster-binding protein [Streptomyces sp. NPDC002308]
MSNEENPQQHGQQGEYDPEPRYGSWQPTRQSGEYDADATAFVHLPPEDLADAPLAAPGHGYVPPMILPLTPAAGHDPAAGGGWNARPQPAHPDAPHPQDGSGTPGAVHWPDPNQQSPYAPYEQTHTTGHHTAQWNFTDGADGTDGTGASAYGVPYGGTSSGAVSSGYDAAPVHEGYPPYTPPGAYEQQPYEGEHGGQDPHGTADHFGHTDHTGHVDLSGHTDHTGHVDLSGHTDHTGHVDLSGHTDHTGHVDLSGHTDHTGHVDLSGNAEPVGHTGQWTIPVADGELPDESGEFAASAGLAQWYTGATPPATLPGGAPAPWATQEFAVPEQSPEPEPETVPVPEQRQESQPETEFEPEPVPADVDPAVGAEPGPVAELPDAQPVDAAEDSVPDAPEAPATAAEDTPVPAPEAAAAPGEPEAPDALDAPGTLEASGAQDAPEAPDAPEADPLRAPVDGEVPAPAPEFAPEEFVPDGFAAEGALPVPEAVPQASEHPSASYVLHVNGVDRPVADAWIGESLLYVLRERLGLAGAKDGCSQGECGACNVQVDGRLVASCLVPAATTAGSEVRTVEGLAVDGEPSDVQRALATCGAVQCGFCIPGMAMTVHDLLEGNHAPSELQTRQALCGNLCRCSGYRGVLDAVRDVVASRAASAEAAAAAPPAGAPEAVEARIPHQAAPGAGGVQAPPHQGDAR